MASVGSFAALKWGPRVRQQAKPVGSPVGIALLVRIEAGWNGQRKWPEPGLRPSLNREASRLGDVRVRRPSSRALVPETIVDGDAPSETCRDKSPRGANMAFSAGHHQSEFLLARLQKAQRSEAQSEVNE